MEREKQEMEMLENENREKLALQEAENVACLDTIKKMNAAIARLQVYTQEIILTQPLLLEPWQWNPASESRDLTVHLRSQTSTPVLKKGAAC